LSLVCFWWGTDCLYQYKKFPLLLLSILNHNSEILNTKPHLCTTIFRAIFLGVWLYKENPNIGDVGAVEKAPTSPILYIKVEEKQQLFQQPQPHSLYSRNFGINLLWLFIGLNHAGL
jgi:hypothetical protein